MGSSFSDGGNVAGTKETKMRGASTNNEDFSYLALAYNEMRYPIETAA
jgi:hypothetical protein